MEKKLIKKETKYRKIFKISLIIFIFILFINMNFHILNKSFFLANKSNSENDTFYSCDRIFLCTLYNNEAEMAYIHIWRLYDYVDKFIIVTSNKTYSGLSKNITFKSFEQNIQPYMNKVDIVNFDNICNIKEYPKSESTWCNEVRQRDYAKNYIEERYNPTEQDLLIVADIDEILTREGIEYIKRNPPKDYYFLKGYYYFPFYFHRLEDCDRSLVVRYNKNMKPLTQYRVQKITFNNTLRFKSNPSKPLVTHCSYCFKDIEEYRTKLKSFSHQEYNKPPYITNDWIFKSHYCREKIGSHIEGYDEPYEGWKHLIPNDERLKYIIDPSFMFPLNQTSFTKKDLEVMCKRKYNRTPFDPSVIYKS